MLQAPVIGFYILRKQSFPSSDAIPGESVLCFKKRKASASPERGCVAQTSRSTPESLGGELALRLVWATQPRSVIYRCVLMFDFEVFGFAGIAAAFESSPRRIGKQGAGHHDISVLFFGSDKYVWRFAMFYPIHNH